MLGKSVRRIILTSNFVESQLRPQSLSCSHKLLTFMCLSLPAPSRFAMPRAAEASAYSWLGELRSAICHSIIMDRTPRTSAASLPRATSSASAELSVTESCVLLQLLMRCHPPLPVHHWCSCQWCGSRPNHCHYIPSATFLRSTMDTPLRIAVTSSSIVQDGSASVNLLLLACTSSGRSLSPHIPHQACPQPGNSLWLQLL